MLERLKDQVLEANLELVKKNLVISTWGNVSGFDKDSRLIVIKASGVHYDQMEARHMVVVDLEGKVVEGEYRPSTDTPTHIDYFYGPIPCTRLMTKEEIDGEYEKNTGRVIIERFEEDSIQFNEMQAVLVHSHGPFTWGKTPIDAVTHSLVLEYISKMACFDELLSNGKIPLIQEALENKHYNRKFGKDAYYGQITEI